MNLNVILLHLSFLIIINLCKCSYIVKKHPLYSNTIEENNGPECNDEVDHSRNKRSLVNFLDLWINTLALTGLRISYYPYQYIQSLFGNHPKVIMIFYRIRISKQEISLLKKYMKKYFQEAKDAVTKEIKDNEKTKNDLKKELEHLNKVHMEQKATAIQGIVMLHKRFKGDLEKIISDHVQDSAKIIEQLCNDGVCNEILSKDFMQN